MPSPEVTAAAYAGYTAVASYRMGERGEVPADWEAARERAERAARAIIVGDGFGVYGETDHERALFRGAVLAVARILEMLP